MKLSLRAVIERARASSWAKPAMRVVLALVGVVVLAWMGRSVAVGGAVPPAAAAPMLEPPSAMPAATQPAPSPALPQPDASPSEATPSVSPAAHAARASPDDPVYLNEATIDDLRRLPGVGEKRALAILELRGKLGKFRQVEDLLRVKGIGRASLKKLRPLVRIERADGGARG